MANIKPCCQNEGNLRVITARDAGVPYREGVVVRRCQECRCRHFEATIDKMVIDVKGSSL